MLTTAESWNYRLKFRNLAFKEIFITGGKGIGYVMRPSAWYPWVQPKGVMSCRMSFQNLVWAGSLWYDKWTSHDISKDRSPERFHWGDTTLHCFLQVPTRNHRALNLAPIIPTSDKWLLTRQLISIQVVRKKLHCSLTKLAVVSGFLNRFYYIWDYCLIRLAFDCISRRKPSQVWHPRWNRSCHIEQQSDFGQAISTGALDSPSVKQDQY